MISHSNTVLTLATAVLIVGMFRVGPASAADTERGRQIFEQTCVACHGADGKGTLPGAPDFTSSSGPLSKDDAVLQQHISEGFQSPGSMMAMPPKGGNADLTAEDIASVLKFIRGQFGG